MSPVFNPETGFESDTEVAPEPIAVLPERGTLVPKVSLHVTGFVAEYLNQLVVAAPFALIELFSVAEVFVIDEAGVARVEQERKENLAQTAKATVDGVLGKDVTIIANGYTVNIPAVAR